MTRSNVGALSIAGVIAILSILALYILALCIAFGIELYADYRFNVEVGGHINRAGHVSDVRLARDELAIALRAAEARGLTHGSTGVVLNRPDYDVGFWYNNMKTSFAELEVASQATDTSSTATTNLLLKIRENLIGHGEHGEFLRVPAGISIFPYNTAFAVVGAMALSVFVIGESTAVIWLYWVNRRKR